MTIETSSPRFNLWLWSALAASAFALAGSLLLSLALGLKACPLCFYQRTFAMSLVALLAMGLLTGVRNRLALLALPLAVGGLGVALFHVSLEFNGKLECPPGMFGVGSAPQQSLAVFAVIALLLLLDVLTAVQWLALLASLVLGGLLAVASVIGNPPMKEGPKEPYKEKLDICRPPALLQ